MTTPASTEALAERLDRLKLAADEPTKMYGALLLTEVRCSDLRALLAEREAMRGALEFYARPYTWRSSTVYMCGHSGPTHADFDAGKKARDALSALTPPAPTPTKAEL